MPMDATICAKIASMHEEAMPNSCTCPPGVAEAVHSKQTEPTLQKERRKNLRRKVTTCHQWHTNDMVMQQVDPPSESRFVSTRQ